MRVSRLYVLALTGAVVALSCVQGSASPPEIDRDEVRAPGAEGPEPIAEVREPFGSKDFPFVVILPDDGTDTGGGWQKATAHLRFAHAHLGIPVHSWSCPVAVGMPLRSTREGRISPSRAALLSAEIANEAAKSLRPEWDDPDVLFCGKLRETMQQMFKAEHPGIGATVSRQ